MNIRTPRSAGSRLSLALVSILLASSTVHAKGLQLRYHARTGEVMQYSSSMEGHTQVFVGGERSSEVEVDSKVILSQEILAVNADRIRMRTRVEGGEFRLNGVSRDVPHLGQSFDSTMRPNGEILEATQVPGVDLSTLQFVLPDGVVNVGTRWTETLPPTQECPAEMAVSYEVTGWHEYKGRRCIVISSDIETVRKRVMNGIGINIKAKGRILFSPNEGMILRNDVKSRMNLIAKMVVREEERRMITKTKLTSRTEDME